MKILVKLLSDDAKMPSYAHDSDSGMDLYSNENYTIAPGETVCVGTGVSVALAKPITVNLGGEEVTLIPEAQVRSKSGIAAKFEVFVLNSPGTVDNSYRGEIKAIMKNTSKKAYSVEKGEKIAQMVITPVFKVIPEEVTSLEETERGEGGFGSTGLN